MSAGRTLPTRLRDVEERDARLVLSVSEAAELVGVSTWLLLQEIKRGNFPHKRVGRRIVISRDRLLAWLTSDQV